MFSYRMLNIFLFAAPAAMLGYGYYLQFVEMLEPCPLCITQRLAFYGIAILGFLAIFNTKRTILKHTFGGLGMLVSAIGAGVASRQLWLQNLPEDEVPACGPGFEYILDTFPLSEALSIMFKGTGDCAEVAWTFLGQGIAFWALLWFIAFFAINSFQTFRKF